MLLVLPVWFLVAFYKIQEQLLMLLLILSSWTGIICWKQTWSVLGWVTAWKCHLSLAYHFI